jgi:translation initiation factor 2 subunit 2
MDYKEMLKRARENMPEAKIEERFEVPVADVMTAKMTTIKNFSEICKSLRREPKHIAKFLFKELAVPGSINGSELVLQGKIPYGVVNQRIVEYVKEFVFCHECGKPDTNLTKDGRMMTMKCEACGARRTVRDI